MTGIFFHHVDFSAHELTYGEHGWYDSKPIEFKNGAIRCLHQLKLQKAGFAANIIENHDEPRGASRYLPEHARNEAGKRCWEPIHSAPQHPVYLLEDRRSA